MAAAVVQARQASAMSEMTLHPPYPATTAALGGLPTIGVDVPICTVFLVLFMIGAASHMTIFQINSHRGHKFIISGMMFGFCMSRLITMVLRIVWAVYPHNARLAIAANVFVSAGVVLLFVINVLFAQRIVRASHPNAGWHPIFHYAFISIYVLIVLSLIALITSVVQQAYTRNLNTKRIDHDIQLYGQTFYAFISFLPFILVVGGLVIPRKTRVEKFGKGRFRHKIAILLLAAFFLCAGASFRAGANYAGGKRPRTDPATYQNKACFYIFNFTVEIIVIYLYVIVRVDKRFFIPNQSHGPGDYSRKPEEVEGKGEEENTEGMHIVSEEETFDDMSLEDLARIDSAKGKVPDEEKADVSAEKESMVLDEKRGNVDEEKGNSADEETKAEQARVAAPNGPASWKPRTPPITPPAPASDQPQEKVIEMTRD